MYISNFFEKIFIGLSIVIVAILIFYFVSFYKKIKSGKIKPIINRKTRYAEITESRKNVIEKIDDTTFSLTKLQEKETIAILLKGKIRDYNSLIDTRKWWIGLTSIVFIGFIGNYLNIFPIANIHNSVSGAFVFGIFLVITCHNFHKAPMLKMEIDSLSRYIFGVNYFSPYKLELDIALNKFM